MGGGRQAGTGTAGQRTGLSERVTPASAGGTQLVPGAPRQSLGQGWWHSSRSCGRLA